MIDSARRKFVGAASAIAVALGAFAITPAAAQQSFDFAVWYSDRDYYAPMTTNWAKPCLPRWGKNCWPEASR